MARGEARNRRHALGVPNVGIWRNRRLCPAMASHADKGDAREVIATIE